MTNIQPASPSRITLPSSPGTLGDGRPGRPTEASSQERRPETRVELKREGIVDAERQNLKIARNLTQKTLSGIEEAQQALSGIADLWREGGVTPEQLRAPASKILETAGVSYKGIQPLMQEQTLQIGQFEIQTFELVGKDGVIPMDALLPNPEAPGAINKAWPQLEQASDIARRQRDRVDQTVAESLASASRPDSFEVQAGLHNLPASPRILELLR